MYRNVCACGHVCTAGRRLARSPGAMCRTMVRASIRRLRSSRQSLTDLPLQGGQAMQGFSARRGVPQHRTSAGRPPAGSRHVDRHYGEFASTRARVPWIPAPSGQFPVPLCTRLCWSTDVLCKMHPVLSTVPPAVLMHIRLLVLVLCVMWTALIKCHSASPQSSPRAAVSYFYPLLRRIHRASGMAGSALHRIVIC